MLTRFTILHFPGRRLPITRHTQAVSKLKNHQLAAALIRTRRGNKTLSKIDPAQHARWAGCNWKKAPAAGPREIDHGPIVYSLPGALTASVCVYSLTHSLIRPRTNCLLNYGSFNKRLLQFAICLPTWITWREKPAAAAAPSAWLLLLAN
jgi:hypothetical protein